MKVQFYSQSTAQLDRAAVLFMSWMKARIVKPCLLKCMYSSSMVIVHAAFVRTQEDLEMVCHKLETGHSPSKQTVCFVAGCHGNKALRQLSLLVNQYVYKICSSNRYVVVSHIGQRH